MVVNLAKTNLKIDSSIKNDILHNEEDANLSGFEWCEIRKMVTAEGLFGMII